MMVGLGQGQFDDAAVVRCAALCQASGCGVWLATHATRATSGCAVGERCCMLPSNISCSPQRVCPAGAPPVFDTIGSSTILVGIPATVTVHTNSATVSELTSSEFAVVALDATAALQIPIPGMTNLTSCSAWRTGAPWRTGVDARPWKSADLFKRWQLQRPSLSWNSVVGGVQGVGGASRAEGGSSRWDVAVNEMGLDAHLSSTPASAVTVVFFHSYWCPFSAGVFPLVAMLVVDFPDVIIKSVDAYTYYRHNARYGILGYPTVAVFRGRGMVGKLLSPKTYADLATFVTVKTGYRVPHNTTATASAGYAAVHTASARTTVALTAAVRNGDVRRAVEMMQLLRELSW